MERSIFGMRLMSLRKARNLTQGQMAEQLQMNRSTYTCYEIGTSMPNVTTMCAIADIFNVTLDYLMGRSDVLQNEGVGESDNAAQELQMLERYRLLNEKRQRLVREMIKELG